LSQSRGAFSRDMHYPPDCPKALIARTAANMAVAKLDTRQHHHFILSKQWLK
tara:strand:+ start:17257 stop:17412 length:156 start_codon:yes stop_codon:yes gene_type:complete